ncbi:MAG: Asp-tRNA(Asn)/Glu-tRNA(Gln) amidotransferase subunit GatC [Methanomassiliicoccales archaeon]
MEVKEVKDVAKIARLVLTDDEIEEFSRDLEDIFNYFSILDEAPTIEDFTLTPVPIENIFREDEICKAFDAELLRKSMKTVEGFVRGPRLV